MKLSCSHAVHGFQSLLEKLPEAKRVAILSFSLDTDPGSPLLHSLRKLPPDCRLTIITNIPGRFESYFGPGPRKQAKKSIDAYLDNLMPENFVCASEVYFSFENHAKILIVDELAYVGSANFTQASASHFEAGVIVTEKGELEELNAFVNEIRKSALPLLKAGYAKEGRTIFRLLLWAADIVRSVREENGFMLSGGAHWIEDEDWPSRNRVKVSEDLSKFLRECRIEAEGLRELCGGDREILNNNFLTEVIEFANVFEKEYYNDSLPKPFDESRVANLLVNKLINECSNDGNVNDVMNYPEYQEQLETAKRNSETELDAAVAEAVDELVEQIEIAISRLRSSFGREDVSRNIDNTKTN